MQDRISTHPNRWVLTPVTGETNTYDFTRADDPTQVGTPLNKATFLPDAVAAAVESATGASGVSLPADALNALASAVSDIKSDAVKFDYGSYVGTGTNSTSNYLDITFSMQPRAVLILSGFTVGIAWVYGMTDANAGNLGRIQFAVNGNTLRRRAGASNTSAAQLMNTSGTTFYYMGVGE